MKHGMNKRGWAGVVIFCLICALPLPAFCERASITEVNAKGSNGAWKVSFVAENCFTDKMNEAIQSGMQTVFTFYLQVYQKRKLWRDRKVASMEFHHTIQFDPIRGEYSVTLEENRSSRTTSDLEEAKRWMAKVEEVEVRPASQLNPGIPIELRIKAELDPVKLPFHLEYLFFFVSLWDFETQWHVEPLLP
jgi:hypothetical protein